MNDKKHTVFEINGVKTLPLKVLIAKTPEGGIPAMGSAQCEIWYKEPEYNQPKYELTDAVMAEIDVDNLKAIEYVSKWKPHAGKLHYFFQFKDDPNGSDMMVNFHRHTEIVSAICDSKLGIDTTPLWTVVRETMVYKEIQAKYRAEEDHDAVWGQYSQELIEIWDRLSEHDVAAGVLTRRIVNMLKLRRFRGIAGEREANVPVPMKGTNLEEVSVFYSYSHRDEGLRDELERHLAALKREGNIKQWHDRAIDGGEEWKARIDDELEAAQVILLLVSSDFLASDYCYDVEMKRALEKHESGEARVIPIILRSCDWSLAPFGKLQALPKDAMAVTSWANQDEALTDVAKGIRKVVDGIRNRERAV